MKGQCKRFVDHRGNSYDMYAASKQMEEENDDMTQSNPCGFFDLWRYAKWYHISATAVALVFSFVSSLMVVSAIVLYGELSALLVARNKANGVTPPVILLSPFGGGVEVHGTNRSSYMDALVDDSKAFVYGSIATMGVQFLCGAISVMITNWVASSVVSGIRQLLLRSVIRQELAFFDTNHSFNFASVVTEEIEKLRAAIGENVSQSSFLLGCLINTAVAALCYGWQLALSALALVPISLVASAIVAKYGSKFNAQEVSAYSIAGRGVQEALVNVATVKAYAGEEIEVNRYSDGLGPAAAAAKKRAFCAGVGTGIGWMMTYALNAVVLAYGTRLIVNDMSLEPDERQYNPGVMLTVLFCTFMTSQTTTTAQNHIEVFSSARAAAGNIYKLLKRKSRIDALEDKGDKPDLIKGDIEFDNVYFNYPSRPDVKILRGFTLHIRAGETVALVGQSGCGKSTALQLLQRLYEPDSGSVTVGGRPLTSLQPQHYRRSIGVVGQEPVLFTGTIRENITLGMENVNDADVVYAAKIAHAHQFISKLVDGYNTMLGGITTTLSGGQKQRVAIARAVIRQPVILLMDEPTSALDPAAEKQVQIALDAASRGRTTIVVTHRLSTIVNASRIVYMEQGSVLEQGTYLELLGKRGAFWKLVQSDMTKTVSQVQAIDDDDDNDDVIIQPTKERLRHRTISRNSSIRSSIRSLNLTPAHVPGPDLLNHIETAPIDETLMESDSDDIPEVSTWTLLKLNAPEWPLLVAGGLASFLVGATMPVFALLFSKIYGMFALSDQNEILSQATLYSILFATMACVCGIVMFAQSCFFNIAGAKLTDRLRVNMFRSYLKQEQAWLEHSSNSVGALCARLATDAAAVQGATGTRLGTMLQGISTLALGTALAAFYSWKMTLVSLVSLPCVIGGIYVEGLTARKAEIAQHKALELAAKRATEAVMHVRTVQSLGVEDPLLEKYSEALESSTSKPAIIRLRGVVYGLCLCAPTLGYTVSMAYGGYLVARENMPYEYAVLVSEALIYGAWILAAALSFAPSFAAAKRAGNRIVHMINRTPLIVTQETAKEIPGWEAEGNLDFKDIHFKYPSRPNVQVLKGLSLSLTQGDTLTLVGPSGCGKSTILQLLMRLYDPDSGTIELDKIDTRASLTLRQLRSQIALVSQEPSLFSRSIRENIAYGDNSRSISIDEIISVAKQANIHDFIISLPLGYDTEIGTGSSASLSGGQKQRVSIARALIRNPRLLLLDEATSALDAGSEQAVLKALSAPNRTTLAVAHRLATAKSLALIAGGKVMAKGDHETLLTESELYRQLHQKQS